MLGDPTRRLDDDRGSGLFHDCSQQFRGHQSMPEVGVTISSGVESVPGVVAVDEIYATGRLHHPANELVAWFAACPGVTGVEHKPGSEVADLGPERGDRFDPAHNGVVAA